MKLWLTYAWIDNEDEDVDFVVNQLRNAGIEVHLDRNRLLAGQRLWEGIAEGIANPDVNGWAYYVSENSLRSEPCREELAYALRRALETRSPHFPIIGIFPENIAEELIPSVLGVRKYVSLLDDTWLFQVQDALTGEVQHDPIGDVAPFRHRFYETSSRQFLEVWPRTGSWARFVVAVPTEEADSVDMIFSSPRGTPATAVEVHAFPDREQMFGDRNWAIKLCSGPINTVTSGHIQFNNLPSVVAFGFQADNEYRLFTMNRDDYYQP